MVIQSVFVWVLTGLFAGWIARLAMRSHREYGLIGDLVTGCLGAVLGGWLLRQMDVWTPPNLIGHVLVALIGAVVLLAALRLARKLGAAVGLSTATSVETRNGNLDGLVRQASDFERGLIAKFLRKDPVSNDMNKAFEAQLTIGERVADRVATFGGSWPFIGIFLATMVVWMAVNEEMSKPFDAYPYILLNLILSCLAAIQAPIIMMSQNRQATRDRLDARNDFEVNVRAEMEIMALHEKLDQLRTKEIMDLVRSVEEQVARLGTLETTLVALTSGQGRNPE